MNYQELMSQRTLTRQQVREIDRWAIEELGVSGLVLMENAGRGVADAMCEIGIAGPVAVCCAHGNNGGDGFVIARHLDLRGFEVRVIHCCESGQMRGDADANYRILTKTRVPIVPLDFANPTSTLEDSLRDADWVVDALLGTGATGPLRVPLNLVVDYANGCRAKKLAVDMPSGMDCDTGECHTPTFRADHTCTFVAAKPGLLNQGSRSHVGQLHVLDIGISPTKNHAAD